MHKASEAACAVTTLLDLAAIAIEDAIAEIDIGARARLDQQHLVAANAEMAIGQEAQLLGCQFERLANPVEHDKVIAESLHLGKCQFHLAVKVAQRLTMLPSLARRRAYKGLGKRGTVMASKLSLSGGVIRHDRWFRIRSRAQAAVSPL
ncbi:MAG: hypothetical protein CAPSK01_004865 [Candidatus Accumulibacter vicinus]|uniref:Uncharacterized protein n=1 Tax=Candidatus Accumulibacter vicinus TaxID=2954382 RepID=A0A084XU79_9PROT|nr:MAG: hypothetical protein CAPSK01_004865 [Candidatus Accumulibacter vicinus]